MLRQLLFLGLGYVHRHKINRLVGSFSLHSIFFVTYEWTNKLALSLACLTSLVLCLRVRPSEASTFKVFHCRVVTCGGYHLPVRKVVKSDQIFPNFVRAQVSQNKYEEIH